MIQIYLSGCAANQVHCPLLFGKEVIAACAVQTSSMNLVEGKITHWIIRVVVVKLCDYPGRSYSKMFDNRKRLPCGS